MSAAALGVIWKAFSVAVLLQAAPTNQASTSQARTNQASTSQGQAPTRAHIFDGLTDAQMCEDLKQRAASTREPVPPVTAQSAAADCEAKRIRSTVAVYAAGETFDNFIVRFVSRARANVCDFERPAMKAFADRGWRYTYIFSSAENELRSAEIEC